MIDLVRQRGYPVYMQIKEQLERRIISGLLASGEMLPSVRGLAKDLMINPNTVVRAYREMEMAGLVEIRHGEGTFVASRPPQEESSQRILSGVARDYVKVAKELGADLEEASRILSDVWEESNEK